MRCGYGTARFDWNCPKCKRLVRKGDRCTYWCFECDDAAYRLRRGISREEGGALARERMRAAWAARLADGWTKKIRSPEQLRLRYAVGALTKKAVRLGFLPMLDGSVRCMDCTRPAVCYDHRDYSRPFDVDPVCIACNSIRGIGRMPELIKAA